MDQYAFVTRLTKPDLTGPVALEVGGLSTPL
jgi:hypothetical protein